MLNKDAVQKKRRLGLEEATGAFLGFLAVASGWSIFLRFLEPVPSLGRDLGLT